MTKRMTLMAMTSMMALAGGMAAAQVALPSGEVTRSVIETAYQGYDYIEIKYGPTQVKVEAVDNGQKVEAVYNRADGTLISSEMEPAGEYAGRTGVVVASLTRDFEDVSGDDDTGEDDSDDTTGSDDSDDNTGGDDSDDSTGGDDSNDSSGGDDD